MAEIPGRAGEPDAVLARDLGALAGEVIVTGDEAEGEAAIGDGVRGGGRSPVVPGDGAPDRAPRAGVSSPDEDATACAASSRTQTTITDQPTRRPVRGRARRLGRPCAGRLIPGPPA